MESRAKSRVETLVSAGGVVYRQIDGRIETVLCGHSLSAGRARAGKPSQSEDIRWSLAKGTPDPGETMEETALREVREETGLDVQLESPLGSINYWFGERGGSVRYHKTVHYYLMVPVGGDTSLHDPEFDVVRWFSLDQALDAIAYPNEADMLRRAQELISKHAGDS